ncbi:MAG: LEA type 2 family protein [Myxococcales bacterium]|jgi:LEA14-like dessication related protein
MRAFVTAASAAALLSACASSQPVPVQTAPTVVSPQTEIEERGQTLSKVDAVVKVLLKNEGEIVANASKAQYELVVDGAVVDKGEVSVSKPIAPGTEETVELTVPFVYAPDQQRLAELDGRKEPLKYAVRGVIDVGGASVEFARASQVRSPRLPKLTVSSFEVLKTEAKGLVVNASVNIANPNPFTVEVSGLRYAVLLGGKQAGEGVLARGAKLPAASENLYDLSIPLEQADLKAKELPVDATSVSYAIQGALEMGGLSVELDQSGNTRLLSAGY